MKLIDKAAVVAEIKKIREHVKRLRYAVDANCIVTVRNACECLESSIDLLVNSIDTLEVKEVGVDFGDPKGDKSVKCIIDTKTLEVKEVDVKNKYV